MIDIFINEGRTVTAYHIRNNVVLEQKICELLYKQEPTYELAREPTYQIGDYFESGGDCFSRLIEIKEHLVGLVRISGLGYFWCYPVKVKDVNKITKDELQRMAAGIILTKVNITITKKD